MRTLGSIFRLLAAINWKASSFRGSWVKNAADRMALYLHRLAAAMRTAGWE
jgi:hypothetical protein